MENLFYFCYLKSGLTFQITLEEFNIISDEEDLSWGVFHFKENNKIIPKNEIAYIRSYTEEEVSNGKAKTKNISN